MSHIKMEEILNSKQKQAVEHKGGPLLIAAGAGSGKTKTLVSRVLHLLSVGVNPNHILAITFTNKAAKEMRDRINKQIKLQENNQPFIGTFHSFGAKILKLEAEHFGRTRGFTIFDGDDSLSLVKKILKETNLPKEKYNPYSVLGKISSIKNEIVDLDIFEEENIGNRYMAIFEAYENILQKSNAFDFDDLIEKPVRLFLSDVNILKRHQEMFDHILVDEYQDINTSQYILVKLLAQNHKNIFVIGDDAQSIYSFRGSDFRNFLNFEKDWKSATIIKLEENYRSSANIIKASSFLIKNNLMQKPKELWTKKTSGELIQVAAFENAEEEAWGICEKVLELIRNGEKLDEMALVYRTNSQSRALEQVLMQSKLPYEIYGGLKFYARKEIKDIIAGLRFAFNPNDIVSFERMEKTFGKIKTKYLKEELPRLSKELILKEIINFIIENTNYLELLKRSYPNYQDRLENITELINFAASFSDPLEFLENAALMGGTDGGPKLRKNAVKLMTIHMAKGLEFDNVFVAGCNERLLPHSQSLMKKDELEEERRLMYVAMTRARKNLFLSFYDLPSRFLGELPPELIEFRKIGKYGSKKMDWDDEEIYLE